MKRQTLLSLRLVRAALEINTSDKQQQELHIEDQDATWFGIVEEHGEPTLRDHGRYSDLMACFPKLQEDRCCPGLIFFVGPTGKLPFWTGHRIVD